MLKEFEYAVGDDEEVVADLVEWALNKIESEEIRFDDRKQGLILPKEYENIRVIIDNEIMFQFALYKLLKAKLTLKDYEV